MAAPIKSRPQAPGYGFDDPGGGVEWSWAEERIAACRNYFIVTTRPDARPHAMPCWGVWIDHVFYFSTAITSVKSVNLLANPKMAFTVENGEAGIIVEGTADIVHTDDVPEYIPEYKRKYGTDMQPDKMWRMRPSVA